MPLPKAIDNNILRSKQIIFFTDGMMDKIKYKKTRIMWFGFLNSGGERGSLNMVISYWK